MICNNCGREVAPDDNYCIYCGTIAKYRTDEVKKTKAVKENNSQLISHKTNLKPFLYVALVFCLIFGVYKMSASVQGTTEHMKITTGVQKKNTNKEQNKKASINQNKNNKTQNSLKTQMSDKECAIEETKSLNFGTYGRIYSKDLGINTALYFHDMTIGPQEYIQSIGDAKDSALCMYYYTLNTKVITDHNYQGFEALKKSQPGKTKIYRVCEDKKTIQEYICESVCHGINNGQTLIRDDGTDAIFSDPGGLIFYTCMDSIDNNEVFIAHYVPTEETNYYNNADLVKTVQQVLNKKGYDCGMPDGIIGEKTLAAIKSFQEENNMDVNGEITAELLNAIEC